MTIEVTGQLGAFGHVLLGERQHWVSITYPGRHTGGEPSIREPRKCSEIGWFAADALPTPLSMITYANCTDCAASPAETGEAGKIESVSGQLRAVSGPTGRLAS